MIPNLPKKNKLSFSTGSPKDDETVYPYDGAAGIYSLRSIGSHGFKPVVRVRRDSDNSERNFSADELNNGFISTWTNRQTIRPLDTRELVSGTSNGGRTGDFIIANTAYSLRSLGDRQAQITNVFPDSYIVSGAGTTAVNGTYIKNGNSPSSLGVSLPAYTLFDTDGTTALFSLISEIGGDNFIITGTPSGGGTVQYEGGNDNTDYNIDDADNGSEPAPSVTSPETDKYVVKVRRSSDNSLKQFTADQITDGTLVDFCLDEAKQFIGESYQYFAGSSSSKVDLSSAITLTGDFDISFSAVSLYESNYNGYMGASNNYIRVKPSNNELQFRIAGGSSNSTTLNTNISSSSVHTFRFVRTSGTITIFVDGVQQSSTISDSGAFVIDNLGRGGGGGTDLNLKGLLYNININNQAAYLGYGATPWNDTIGSNNGTANNTENFTGQGFDGFVRVWYDQSVSDQAGTPTGNHAVQTDESKQPLIVESGSVNVDSFSNPTIRFEKDSETHFISTNSNLDPNLEVSAFVVQKDEQVVNQNSGWVAMRKSTSSGQRSAFEMGVNRSSERFRLVYDTLADNTDRDDIEVTVASDGLGTTSIMTGIKTSSGDLDGFFNGSSVIDTTVTDNTDLGSGYGITIGKHTNSGQYADGRLNEVIFYLSDQTENRGAFESNMAEHYGISGVPSEDDQVNGFVETWYDQSGNGNNAVQSVADTQSKIVSAGSYLGLLNFNDSIYEIPEVSAKSVFALLSVDTSGTGVSDLQPVIGNPDTSGKSYIFISNNNGNYNGYAISVDGAVADVGNWYMNGVFQATGNNLGDFGDIVSDQIMLQTIIYTKAGDPSSTVTRIGQINPSSSMNGTFKELIIFSTAQTSLSATLVNNINDTYNIY